jgi:hypothetical protein
MKPRANHEALGRQNDAARWTARCSIGIADWDSAELDQIRIDSIRHRLRDLLCGPVSGKESLMKYN